MIDISRLPDNTVLTMNTIELPAGQSTDVNFVATAGAIVRVFPGSTAVKVGVYKRSGTEENLVGEDSGNVVEFKLAGGDYRLNFNNAGTDTAVITYAIARW